MTEAQMKKEALAKIAEVMEQIDKLFAAAEQIATTAGVEFSFTMRGRDDYGNTYTFREKSDWEDSGCSYADEVEKKQVWVSSSDYC